MKNFGKTTDIKDIITVGYEADNAVLYSTSQSLTNDQKIQARTNIGAGISDFDGNYNSLSNKPTIPTKTSQLNNDSNFATTSQVEAKYTKPTSGIPKTDLATAVQNSLTAADNAVKYTSQSLTDAQKVQARTNIGAGTSNFSGSYNDLTNKPTIPAAVSIVQSTGTSTSSVMSQKATTDAVNGRLSKTDNTNIEVLGTKKATTTLGGNQLYAPNGAIFGGTAAAAGLLTKGISGISVPTTGGACSKDNLYVNYDGNNDFNADRQIVLNAGTVGNHLGSNMYQYTIPRGDIVKNWVEAKGYATSVKVNGNTIASSGGVVDIGTVLTDESKFATSAQGTKADNAMPKSGGTFTGNISVPKTITFTDETNPFIKMRTGGTDFYFQSTSGQFGLGPTWDKATHWDSNGNVTFPIVPKVGNSSLALKSEIPTDYVKYTAQTLTDAQKSQARSNIGAGTSNFSGNYNDLPNIPVQNQDLAVSGFTPVANSYYRHIGTTTDTFTQGVIYLYNGTGYAALDGAAANNGTLTIQKNGTNVQTFTANQSSSVTANITVPTKVSELTNDSGYTTNKGTITGINMNGESKGTSGVVDLGTVITAHQDISGKANLSGGNTFTGTQTLNNPGSGGYSINAGGYIKGSWLQSSATSNKGANTGKVCVFDENGWIYYRTPTEILSDAGGAKSTDIPTKTSELTNDSGFITSGDSVKSVIDYGDNSKKIKIGYAGAGISGDSIKYIAGYTTGDSESYMRIKDINKDAMKAWLGYAAVATSGSYNDLSNQPTFSLSGTTLTITL